MNAPRIVVLPAHLADQIAAGEVVERPASVVKELVENALDAGARRIEVELEQGGRSLIRVTDDGDGMTSEEAHLALKRHATSKLRRVDDLFTLSTLGFRGEALPSIAAVSRLVLTTRTAQAVAAYRLAVDGGHEQGPGREAGAPVGTQVEVRDLLYNVPARLKFLKGEATEAGHIAEALVRLALAFPQVHFKLRQEHRVVLDLPAHPSLHERAQAALTSRGRRSGPAVLYPARGEEHGVTVEAYLGVPAECTTTPRNTYLVVNSRFIRDRSLLHATVMGYGELLDRGRYPFLVVHVSLAGEEVDINVHPQKLEVRFAKPQIVYAAVRHVIRKAAQEAPWLVAPLQGPGLEKTYRIDEDEFSGAGENLPAYGAARDDKSDERGGAPPVSDQGRQAAAGGPLGRSGLTEHRSRLQHALEFHERDTASPDGPDRAPTETGQSAATGQPAATGQMREIEIRAPKKIFYSSMEYLSQIHRTYLLCMQAGELVLIDQHAAHERLAFERLRASYAQARVRSQRLLFPLSFEVDATRAGLFQEHEAALADLGFDVQPFGGRSFALLGAPDMEAFGRGAKVYQDPEKLLLRVLEDLEANGRSDLLASRMELVLATIACHSVVRAGDVLTGVQAEGLLQSMDEFEFYPHCPHGRPVLVRMPQSEIEKKFGRT